MADLVQQLPLAVLLPGGVALGYQRWIRPRRPVLDLRSCSLLLLLILASMAGFLGSPFWWFDVRQSFSWDLPPLASRMLAAAALSLTVGAVLALERPVRARVRLYLILLATYLVPLVVAVCAFHLDRFDASAPITYGFFAAAVAVTVPAVVFLCRQPEIAVPNQLDPGPIAPLEKAWLLATAAVTGTWGVVLFVTHDGPLETIWVWPGDMLSSRLIAVMLLALAAGSAYSAVAAEATATMLWVLAVYGALVPVASAWNALTGKPMKPAYIVVFALLAAGSLALLGRRAFRLGQERAPLRPHSPLPGSEAQRRVAAGRSGGAPACDPRRGATPRRGGRGRAR